MKDKETKNQPIEVIVGQNYHATYYESKILPNNDIDFSPDWSSRPYVINDKIEYSATGFPRTQTSVKFITNDDTADELLSNYSIKSIMSTDGILSPISFYPTPNSSTFHITKYITPECPFCNGTKNYTYRIPKDNRTSNFDGINNWENQMIEKTKPCPFCEELSSKQKKYYTSAVPRESYPPFIVASGDDLQIISNIDIGNSGGTPIINYSTLNPFVLYGGEFGVIQNKQSGDYSVFSIDMVAHGMMPPRSGDGLRPFYSTSGQIFNAYSPFDRSIKAWRDELISKQIAVPPLPASGRRNNIRSFALRGPIMLHSWGYDLDGFPVPNSSGEPLIENKRVILDENNNVVGKNQKRTFDSEGNPTWTKPYKETTFYKGWAQSPGTWPVGPIDFRWDSNAGVWTVGSNYRPVFIVLEEDMVSSQPVRGSILDLPQSTNPLPSGLRKLVFVRDLVGNFSAPRGAAVYCRYDSSNGFYEPINRTATITSGVIISQVLADIYKAYAPTNVELSMPPSVDKYRSEYSNPLGYKTKFNSLGLFIFLNGVWVLQSYNCE